MQICVFQAFFRNEPFNLFELFQRRLSDPSANLTNYSRGGWRSKDGKSRSENEGLDSLISGVAEVEAGDLRDGESNGFFKLIAIMRFMREASETVMFLFLR